MSKRLKKELQIMIDEKVGQLFLGEKKKDMRLLMLRPIDLMEFTEFAGTNADDILTWVGKTLGRSFMEKFFYSKDWTLENIVTKKDVFLGILESMELMGYGQLRAHFGKNKIQISITDPLSSQEKDNIMAKNLCLLYLGIFQGVFETINIDVEGKESECVLLGAERCIYQFDLIGEELDSSVVDPEPSEEAVSDFLSTL
jgi:predicted hydrocarbon binding protein